MRRARGDKNELLQTQQRINKDTKKGKEWDIKFKTTKGVNFYKKKKYEQEKVGKTKNETNGKD